ncbi:MAG: hypothetical protein GC179_17135 [Anaerolineaceae bacterium]|nr:hypothetical protein [Anaerolineaceae bacterium]
MDFATFLAPLFGIAFLVERVLESAWNIVELMPNIQKMKIDPATAPNYSRIKQIVSVLAGILIGMFAANVVKLTMFAKIGIVGLDPSTDALISGAIAGTLAPYAHQILEGLLNLQKLLQQQQQKIAADTPPVVDVHPLP